jgi:hypothetical protein
MPYIPENNIPTTLEIVVYKKKSYGAFKEKNV